MSRSSRLSPAEAQLRRLEARGARACPWRAGRSMAMGRRGMVATSHTLATLAGLDMLRAGGSALDAAIAAAAALAVVEPMMTGPGGDVWMLYYEAKTGRVRALNGSGRSPRALTREQLRARGLHHIAPDSWESVTVPGAPGAWLEAHARFGRLPFAATLAPAIELAAGGFPVTEQGARMWRENERALRRDPWTARAWLTPEGRAPRAGEVFRAPALARTLRRLAEEGREGFYGGPIAREIVRHARETGGYLRLEDFREAAPEWVEPVSTRFGEYEVFQCPPNGQGLAVLLLLNLLENDTPPSPDPQDPAWIHLCVEAKKLAFADTERWVADPAFAEIPLAALLSKSRAAGRRALIRPDRAMRRASPGPLPAGEDTVYLCAADAEGNAVSFINSLYYAFGSKITGGSTGVLLQCRGAGFSLKRGHPNEYAPGKRPFHTIIPGMVLRAGALYMAYGVMGGSFQPQGHAQFLLNHLRFGMTPQEAMDCPRWRHDAPGRLWLEHGVPRATHEALRALGHNTAPAPGGQFGGAQAILQHPESGVWIGASDPRKDGAALGF